MAALNPRTVVVLEGGSAITMPWVNDVEAILMAWYPGQLGGEALADILFGDVNPSGRLPLSFPRRESDLPPFDNRNLTVRYGSLHGYRWLDRRAVAPLFPFGFGLSYTTFRLANLALSSDTLPRDGRVQASVDVANTGGMAGDTVIQLYVTPHESGTERAPRELRDFARVALEPGETRTIVLGSTRRTWRPGIRPVASGSCDRSSTSSASGHRRATCRCAAASRSLADPGRRWSQEALLKRVASRYLGSSGLLVSALPARCPRLAA